MITGAFPRSKAYTKLLSRYNKQKIDDKKFEDKSLEIIRKVLYKLKENGLDIGSDLMYLDDDIFYPFIKDLENTDRGWLVRFYDNNFFVRNIIIKDKIGPKPDLKQTRSKIALYEKIKQIEFHGYAVALPGPLTISSFTVDEKKVYNSVIELIYDYVKSIKDIAKQYSDMGYIVEIHEPELSYPTRMSSKDIIDIYDEFVSSLKNVHLLTYFGYLDEKILENLPQNITLGIDIVSSNHDKLSLEALKQFNSIRLGLVDSRNTKLENIYELKRIVEILVNNEINVKFLSFNTMTEFLPEIIAYKKIKLLYKLSRVLES